MPFRDYFSSHSKEYAWHRPSYPESMFDYLASLAPGRELAWDCGTGNGQAALALTNNFQQVVATDASAAQVEKLETIWRKKSKKREIRWPLHFRIGKLV